MSKTSILFVDDHKEVLNGLKRMTRSMRSQWQPSFALGGAEAIEMLEQQQFDVLVTDMRMPGVDGVQVLLRALELQPMMVRIVLSGQYDIEYFVRSGWPVHRFLAKPCDDKQLKLTIEQALAMRSLLEDRRLRALVTKASRLPVMPDIYMEIEAEMRSDNASMQRVGAIVARDVSLTAKILQLINAPIFGSSRRVESPEQAVVMLGGDVIKSLALYIQSCSEIPAVDGVSLERLSQHSMRVGRLAREIADCEGMPKQLCSSAFLAGMLQNVGTLMIMNAFPETYVEIAKRSADEQRPLWLLEQEALGANHAKVGGYLLSLWGLDTEIAEAVAYHLQPSGCPNPEHSFALTAVHIANALEMEPGIYGTQIANALDEDYLEARNLSGRLPVWQGLQQKIIQEYGV